MMQPRIAIVMGSKSDFKLVLPGLERLRNWEVGFELFIASAHRTPSRVIQWLKEMERRGVEVIVAAAGGAAHLPGVVAAHTILPVIGLPLDTTHMRGMDALYSIVQMPRGIPVATVGINNVENALLLAMHILALKYPEYAERLKQYRGEFSGRLDRDQGELQENYPELFPTKGAAPKERMVKEEQPAPPQQTKESFETEVKKQLAQELSDALEQEKTVQRQKRKQKPAIYKVDLEHPDPLAIEEAMVVLLEGGIVALPTDTVYGIAADGTNPRAVKRLYELKGRPHERAIPLLIHNTKMLRHIVTETPRGVKKLIDTYWPGGLTIVFRKYRHLFQEVSGEETIGLRMPDNIIALGVISMVGRPLATTSANRSGQPPATTAEEVKETFGDQIDLILDGGKCPGGGASTVISVVKEPFELLREGAITAASLKELLGKLLKG